VGCGNRNCRIQALVGDGSRGVTRVPKETALRFRSLLSAVCVAGSLAATPMTVAGELVPYAPPVSQTVVRAVAPATTAQKAAVVVPESFYAQFEVTSSKLTDQQRKELVATFGQSRDAAEKSGDVSRVIHYQRLLEILGRTP